MPTIRPLLGAVALLLPLMSYSADAPETVAPAPATTPVPAAPTSDYLALRTRAEAGDSVAQFEVGKALETGRGTGMPRDFDQALVWYRKSADQGYAEAQSRLGSYYQADSKPEEAVHWLRLAASQDHPRAMNNLAFLYDVGNGVTQDRERALDLYKRAADLGWPEAMWNLANIYGSGRYGNRDMEVACIWTLRAGKYAQPNFKAVTERVTKAVQTLERGFTAVELQRCRDQAEDWAPKAAGQTPQ